MVGNEENTSTWIHFCSPPSDIGAVVTAISVLARIVNPTSESQLSMRGRAAAEKAQSSAASLSAPFPPSGSAL